jgi:2,3,4,5-tetrahydropyridine-2-carboxylate N-succinyltransferase
MDDEHARGLIEEATQSFPEAADARAELASALDHVLDGLEDGRLRVAHPTPTGWAVDGWIRAAILLLFRARPARPLELGGWSWHDKIDLQITPDGTRRLAGRGVRLVPPAIVRRGAYIGARAVLMPSYVNIGAHVGEETLVDTWATVGSCAQIGARVHLSGGVGIGGVLEPLQARPVIVEDDCFIGARSEIVDGVRVRRGAVVGMGVFLGASTKIYDRATGTVSYGEIPEYAVVVPGTLPSTGGCQLACAVIVKRVDAKTRERTAINELLRT